MLPPRALVSVILAGGCLLTACQVPERVAFQVQFESATRALQRGQERQGELLLIGAREAAAQLPERRLLAANRLSTLYLEQGRLDQAEPLLMEILLLHRQLYGADDLQLARPLNHLAILRKRQGRLEEALELCRQAEELLRGTVPPEHPVWATIYTNRALVLMALARPDQAALLLRQALAIDEEALGPDHPAVARDLNHLGEALRLQGMLARARPLLERSVDIHRRLAAGDPTGLGQALNNLGVVLAGLGLEEEAEECYTEAGLRLQERGRRTGLALSAIYTNRGNLYRQQGDAERAGPLYREALRLKEEALGLFHPEVSRQLNNLAAFEYDRGAHREAEAFLERALQLRAQAGTGHPATARVAENLARVKARLGKLDEAQALFEQALRIKERTLPPEALELGALRAAMEHLSREQARRQRAAARSAMERVRRSAEQLEGERGTPIP